MQAAQAFLKRSALAAFAAVLVAATVVAMVGSASAQQEERRYLERPRNIFEFLFGPPARRAEPLQRPRVLREPRRQRTREGAWPRESASPRARAEPEVVAVEKAETAKPLLIVGDFLAGGLADALETVYAQNPNVRVVEQISGSSGFVRDDFYDWPKEIVPTLEEVKPAAVVVMIGSNDRQEMKVDGVREQRRSEKWTEEYKRRVRLLTDAIRSRNIPLVWVGMPSFQPTGASADMLAFNDIYRQATEEAGGEFVDIWEGFVDESGAFVTSGPDMNGQPVRLRSGDNGVNMTNAGRRKVAFYAEKPLERIFGSADGQQGATAGLPAAPGLADPVVPPAQIDRTEPISLADPQLEGATSLLGAPQPAKPATAPDAGTASGAGRPELAGAAPKTGQAEMTLGEKLSVKGIAPTAAPGRADDFGAQSRAAPKPPAETGTTTSIVE